jgi:hypothetical protein
MPSWLLWSHDRPATIAEANMSLKIYHGSQRVAWMWGNAIGEGSVSILLIFPVMQHKVNAARRHRIPRPKQRVTN